MWPINQASIMRSVLLFQPVPQSEHWFKAIQCALQKTKHPSVVTVENGCFQ